MKKFYIVKFEINAASGNSAVKVTSFDELPSFRNLLTIIVVEKRAWICVTTFKYSIVTSAYKISKHQK